ncbi:adenosylcobinamide kinase/adenosylcobinamide phosphate guanyltransferase [Sphingopyxis sp. H038]|uniref:bifunctional adenosylcobinamide kinase/adenosylcobinamide-phosphate guanylyltransferase n=1 Tax=unclassified Sphingopyxis TaxID=2614943 RepID=UPI0007304FB0|nr:MULTISPECIES: bifunctional adenosylcobinamide kinase/adenosylcobinamide-phosphate guanylyltransferase [unclassified Sphingopyxis]KTE03657.1 adenosylcobinamide kinase/adenosylcobinamide phosphate guanyltransferase [Sphingopyxis sp. H012]KTE09114.1 adenosylcobinamide kinase/adenosylcobinamide phosphate guanyltransferase [Sphingopyxis sp. H053]KTE14916.1 adenosylcobinamide kinase/adenosylcobinamide phosphate guanyltransferase [Sphingopyxis sp. H093]KTE24976.1 adenosylcobinamide kinase/adenosylc
MSGSSLFVLGGARSGKSRYAQARTEAAGGSPVFVATAEAFDDEMHERIARHQADRDARWRTVEAPRDLPAAIDALDAEDAVVLVDCLTLWVSNLLLADADIPRAGGQLCHAINRFKGTLILVANEVGLGIVPDNALARAFRDAAGQLNQSVAATVDEVVLLTAGLPLTLKPRGA